MDTKDAKNAKSGITTIKLGKETKERLEKLRSYKRESYDEILEKIIDILNVCRVSPLRARGRLILIDRQRRLQLRRPKPQNSSPIVKQSV